MSDYFPGHHHHQPPCLRHWSDQNVMPAMPFAFTSYFYYSDHFVVNGGGDHLLHHPYQSNNHLPEPPPATTANLRAGTWGRGGAKAYFRFHGGIGDGCCGIACRNNEQNTIARPLQLFDALGPINFQMVKMTAGAGLVTIPVIGDLPAEASDGTGVFLPVYSKRIRSTKGMYVHGGRGNGWKQRRGGRMKEEDTFSKPFVGDAVKKEERKDISEMPIEVLLPAEWTY